MVCLRSILQQVRLQSGVEIWHLTVEHCTAEQISSSNSSLNSGASKLASGTQTPYPEHRPLHQEQAALTSDARALMDGEINSDGSDQLKDGISDLNDGAKN